MLRCALRCTRATQVADRFHLLQNLAEVLDQVFTAHDTALTAVNEALRQQPMSLADGQSRCPGTPRPPTPAQPRAAQRQARRQTMYK